MDPDTRFALWTAPICGALGSAVERMMTYYKLLPPARPDQLVFLQGKTIDFVIYIIAAAIVVTAAMMLFPINRQNRPQVIGTSIVFGMVWPTLLDRIVAIANVASQGPHG